MRRYYTYKDRVTNEKVCTKTQQATGPHEDLLTIVKRRKLKWYGPVYVRPGQNHLARHSEREKKARQTEEEVGRQHQGMDKPGVPRVPEKYGEQRKKWRKLVVTSSVVPHRPPRLTGR